MILSECLSKLPVFHGNNNNGVSKTKSQDKIREYFIPVKEIRDNPGEWVANMPKKERRILAAVVDLSSRYKIVHARQDTIAAMAQCSRKHCNTILKKWDKQGVVRLEHRGYISNKTKLSPWFKNCSHLLPKLGQLLYAFLSLSLLVPVNAYENVTRREEESIYIKYSYIDNNTKRTLSNTQTNINTQKGEIQNIQPPSFDSNSRVLLKNLMKLFNYDEKIVQSLSKKAITDLIRNRPELLKE